jgi:hypothetical protein
MLSALKCVSLPAEKVNLLRISIPGKIPQGVLG